MAERVYTLQNDTPDSRDLIYVPIGGQHPASVDLRPHMPPVYSQGSYSSCTANALVAVREYDDLAVRKPRTPLSRMYVYWHERFAENALSTDHGASLRDGLKTLNTLGVCPESDFPYTEVDLTAAPSVDAESHAKPFRIAQYRRVLSTDDMLDALANGIPVVFAGTIYESFESADAGRTGIIPMPNSTAEKVLGGHALVAVGYTMLNDSQYIIFRNSWGDDWGEHGYGYLPLDYFRPVAWVTDKWVMTTFQTLDTVDYDTAIDWLTTTVDPYTGKPVFDSPDFWKSLGTKYVNDPTSDFRYVALALRKAVVYAMNNVGR